MKVTIGVVGLVVNNRADHAPEVQRVLTKYGNVITSRMGIPNKSKDKGFITLGVEGDQDEINCLTQELRSIDGVCVSSTVIEEDRA